MSSKLEALNRWVEDVARLTRPDRIHWCDGSADENQALIDQMVRSGDLIALNPQTHPNCYLHRSDPTDVARVEHLTYVCTRDPADAGPNNNWMSQSDARERVWGEGFLLNFDFSLCISSLTRPNKSSILYAHV